MMRLLLRLREQGVHERRGVVRGHPAVPVRIRAAAIDIRNRCRVEDGINKLLDVPTVDDPVAVAVAEALGVVVGLPDR
jgi:hypothetical protein